MIGKHNRIYRMISSFTSEQSEQRLDRLTDIETSKIIQINDEEVIVELQYDGKVCHWREGDLNYSILYLTEKQVEFIKEIDKKLHEGLSGYTLIDDITEDVLYEKFDTSVFGFLEFEMKYDFFRYRQEYLTKDDVLDKMLKYGKESLTENDKLLLEDKQMISPIDEI